MRIRTKTIVVLSICFIIALFTSFFYKHHLKMDVEEIGEFKLTPINSRCLISPSKELIIKDKELTGFIDLFNLRGFLDKSIGVDLYIKSVWEDVTEQGFAEPPLDLYFSKYSNEDYKELLHKFTRIGRIKLNQEYPTSFKFCRSLITFRLEDYKKEGGTYELKFRLTYLYTENRITTFIWSFLLSILIVYPLISWLANYKKKKKKCIKKGDYPR